MASSAQQRKPSKGPTEFTATIEDFFSDEKDSSSNDSDEDSDDAITGAGGTQRQSESHSKKKKKKKLTAPDHSLPCVDMPPNEFRRKGKELIDFIADYMEGTREKAAMVNVHPGFIFRTMAKTAPKDGCPFDALMTDIKTHILPGIPQWQNPGHHAFMPLGGSYASLLGSILSDGLGCASFTWNECPASTELEMVVMNWLAEVMDLPLDFHFYGKGHALERIGSMHPTSSTRGGATGFEAGAGRFFGGFSASSVNHQRGSILSDEGSELGAQKSSSSDSSPSSNGELPFIPGGHSIKGGGIILNSTIECFVTVMVAAKRVLLDHLATVHLRAKETDLVDLMMAYCSEQGHPGMERVCEIVGVTLKRVWTDREGIMHCNTLRSFIEKDRSNGYIPFFVVGTAGTIASASVDQLDQIGPFIAEKFPRVWFHIDGSYAGSAFICREYQPLGHGINYADSINVSAHKWLPVHMDCACLWVKKIPHLTHTFNCEDPEGPLTIPVESRNRMADYRNWGIPMMRKFKAIKVWTVIKLYGIKKLQQKIREDVRRAKELERVMQDDHRFEIMANTMFAIVTFRCKRPDMNEVNQQILHHINRSLIIKMTGARVGRKFWLRFVVAGRYTTSEDVLYSWEMIKRATSEVTAKHTERIHNEDRCGVPNYTHVIPIGKEPRLDDLDSSMPSVSHTKV